MLNHLRSSLEYHITTTWWNGPFDLEDFMTDILSSDYSLYHKVLDHDPELFEEVWKEHHASASIHKSLS